MGELEVALVAVDRKVWSGRATQVSARSLEGDIGILPRHEPVLALLAEGPVRITTTDGDELLILVHGGFFSVDSDNVTILAESAEFVTEIDVDRAKAALARTGDSDEPAEVAARARADARVRTAESVN